MAEKDTSRVEAFSDGVFGVAITLLIVEFKVPHAPDSAGGNWQLLASIGHLWPSLVAYILSFGTVLVMWVNHHGLFKHAHRVNHRLMFANGFLLLVVTFVPFPTAVLAEYLDKPGANTAAAFYCGTFVLINIGYNLLLRAVISNQAPGAIGSAGHEAALARVKRAYYLGIVVYSLATLASLFSAFAGLAVCLPPWIGWALLDYSPEKTSRIT